MLKRILVLCIIISIITLYYCKDYAFPYPPADPRSALFQILEEHNEKCPICSQPVTSAGVPICGESYAYYLAIIKDSDWAYTDSMTIEYVGPEIPGWRWNPAAFKWERL